jgi:polyketide synthase PksJ
MNIKASYHQERLWFIDRFESGYLYEENPLYHNVPLIVRVRGEVDLPVLEQSIRQVIRRHEALRTRIVTRDNEPRQVIEPDTDFKLEVLAPGSDAVDQAVRWCQQPLPLDGDSLLRGMVIPSGQKEVVLTLCIHHIVIDRYSLKILVQDIFSIYEARLLQQPPRLEDLPLQYADFSQWQRNLPAEALESLLFYWRSRLGDGVSALELPTHTPRAAVHIFRPGRLAFKFPPSLCEQVGRCCRERGHKPSLLLLAAFKILLHRYSRQAEIVVGTSEDNRGQPELARVVGPIANLLVLRSRIEGGCTWEQFLGELQADVEGALRCQQMPFDRLVSELNPRKDMSRTALFDVLFQYDDQPPDTAPAPNLTVEVVETNLGWGKYDLNLLIRQKETGISGMLVFNKAYFLPAAIGRLVLHYRLLLERLLSNPALTIDRLDLLSAGERRQLLAAFDRRQVGYPRQQTIHGLFEHQAEAWADRIALVGGGQISYGELNQRAEGLARRLTGEGVGEETIAAVSAVPSGELIVGILAILKAGGAYLPIDPDYPRERIDFMLQDSGSEILLTGLSLTRLGGSTGLKCVSRAGFHNLAYVIYTSGSTGKPKGSLIEHGSVVQLLKHDGFPFDFGPTDTWTLFHSGCFDFSVWEMYGALLYGGKLVIVPRPTARSAQDFLHLLRQQAVTVLNQTPPVFYGLIDRELKQAEKTLALRWVIFGGEALRPAKLKPWQARYPRTQLINMFGITETTVHVTYKEITDREIQLDIGNIGTPIPTLATYVTDDWGRLLPIGLAGELCVAGPGVCRGYLNRPELSAEKFVDNPFPPAGRIYRSGDLVKVLPGGEMEYLGRIDHQVKIRGFRIELGEIEAQLLKHDAVKEAVVIARQDRKNEKYLTAYIVPPQPNQTSPLQLREYLSRTLPPYMIPAHFVTLNALPLTVNGKVDRRGLPEPTIEANETQAPPKNEIEIKIARVWAQVLNIDSTKVGRETNFFDIGGNSLKINRVTDRLEELYRLDIPAVSMFEFPTIREFAAYLGRQLAGEKDETPAIGRVGLTRPEPSGGQTAVAVVGMAGRFPGADHVEQFWQNLKEGRESIAFFSEAESSATDSGRYVRAGGYLPGKEYFDAAFFDLPPADADILDPQIRVFLECVWTALESANCDPETCPGPIGVYVGGGHHFDWEARCRRSGKNERLGEWAADKLNNIDYLSTRVAYHLDLQGPTVTVQTACSTSLVAVHLACRALRQHECRAAAAGGVEITTAGKSGYLYQEGLILSGDGHCRAFSTAAGGTVAGEGAGVVVLKLLENALADGDTVLALIKGSAVNNDGRHKVGFMAPGVRGQRQVITSALRDAGVEPGTIGYLECHGTGTRLGDPLEIEALKQAFGTGPRGRCYIGSVKTNIGHLGSAAGVVGLIKTVLVLKHRQIPGSLHFESPHPEIDFDSTPFRVNTGLLEWTTGEGPRRAGVSSFGIGGTNAHVILEEAVEPAPPVPTADEPPSQLIVLSARTGPALERMTENLADFFKRDPGIHLGDAAFSLQVGRRAFPYRRMAVASDVSGVVGLLTGAAAEKQKGVAAVAEAPVVFMFPGQGAQYAGMGRDLYRHEPLFRREMDRCFEILAPLMDGDLKEILYPRPASRHGEGGASGRGRDIDRTACAQPLLFSFEYALARLLMAWGLHPQAMIGHSIGEYTAACLAGVFSLEDALDAVAARARLMQELPAGAMLSIPLEEGEVTPLLGDQLALAAVNAPDRCLVSGPVAAIEALARQLAARDIKSTRLHTSHAFHSAMMEPMLKPFEARLRRLTLQPPRIPIISNLTGKRLTRQQALDPGYWCRHLRRTVRFYDGLGELLTQEALILLEIGPGSALTTFARQHRQIKPAHVPLNLVRHPQNAENDHHYLLDRIGSLWLRGQAIDWPALHGYRKRRRLPLPTYPFERVPFPLDGDRPQGAGKEAGTGPLEKKRDPAEWFYVPSWKRQWQTPSQEGDVDTPSGWLIFSDRCGLGTRLAALLEEQGQEVTVVGPENARDFDALFTDLYSRDRLPKRIVWLRGVTEPPPKDDDGSSGRQWLDTCLEDHFYGLVELARSLGRQPLSKGLTLTVVTNDMQAVTGTEPLQPEKAVVLGPVQVISLEYDHIECRSLDLDVHRFDGRRADTVIRRLLAELQGGSTEQVVAFRGLHRWVRRLDPFPLKAAAKESLPLKKQGVYLITGGLGGIGLELAEYLARTWQARLILTGRSPFPPRGQWQSRLDSPEDPGMAAKIGRLLELERLGGRVMVARADVSEYSRMQRLIQRGVKEFGPLNGVIHAAGVPDGRIIQLRDRALSEEVLSAKVEGTQLLLSLLRQHNPDFMLFCSSLDALLPDIGQVAYAAGNSFLDAAAWAGSVNGQPLLLSLNWDAWQQQGMAARASGAAGAGGQESGNCLFCRCFQPEPHRWVYVSRLRVKENWFLHEHRLFGRATVPGTAYLEIAAAALEHHRGRDQVMEIEDFYFLSPLTLAEDEEREVHTSLMAGDGGFRLSINSRTNRGWQEHARGRASLTGAAPLETRQIEELTVDCRGQRIETAFANPNPTGPLKVGPRWHNLRWRQQGQGRAVARLELPKAFHPDLETYQLHPALLDNATSFFIDNLDDGSALLPFSIRKMTIRAPLPGTIYSFINGNDLGEDGDPDSARQFDIRILDESGRGLVDIEGFLLRPLGRDVKGADAPSPFIPLKNGLLPGEGVEVFCRVLAAGLPQVVVSTVDLRQRQQRRQQGEQAGELPKPAAARPGLKTPYVQPLGPTQQTLAEIWQETLGIGGLGLDDDFFELGGDSLRAVTMLPRINRRLEAEVPLTVFFNKPTIAQLAAYIDGPRRRGRAPVPKAEKRSVYALSSAQKRLYILQQMFRDNLFYNLPEIKIMEELPDLDRLQAAFRRLIARHHSLRTAFRLHHSGPVQMVLPLVDFHLPFREAGDIEPTDGAGLNRLIEEFVRPFDLSRPPLLRSEVVRLAGGKYGWLFDIHHIVADAVGVSVLQQELTALYRGESLAPVQFQYTDFSRWQNRLLQEDRIKEQEAYWLNLFADGVPQLNFPTDYPRPPVPGFVGGQYYFELEAESAGAFKKIAAAAGVTLYVNLLTALYVLLFKYTGQEDVVVGTATDGRSRPEFRQVVGMFINILPLRNCAREQMTYLEFLKGVRAAVLAAFENQDMPFDRLVDKLNIERTASRNPLFDVCFNFVHYEQLELDLAGVKCTPYTYETQTSTFDLLLWADDRGRDIHFMLSYSSQLFTAATAEKFGQRYLEIIRQVVKNSEIRLKEIALGHDFLTLEENIFRQEAGDFGF